MTSAAKCPACGASVQPDWAFCQQCAADIRQGGAGAVPATGRTCRRCQAPLLPGSAFCGACGVPTRRVSPAALRKAALAAAVLLVVAVASVVSLRWWRARPIDLQVSSQEQVLATLPRDISPDSGTQGFHLQFSADGRRVAYSLGDRESFETYVGDLVQFRSKPPRFVGEAVLTIDGKRLAFSFAEADLVSTKMYAVVDGTKSTAYDFVATPVFSRNGRRVGFMASRDNKVFTVVDGQEIESGATGSPSRLVVGVPVFSDDGSRTAHVGFRGGRYELVVDGRKEATLTGIGGLPEFSPDGSRIAYVTGELGNWVMVVGEERSKPQAGNVTPIPSRPVFSRDGRRVVFPVQVNGQSYLYEGGRAILGPFEFISNVRLSPDGRHVACLAGNREGAHVWMDGERLPMLPVHLGVEPVFSPVEPVVAYPARLDKGPGIAFSDGRVIDTGNVNTPWVAFSGDGRQVSYGEVAGRQLWWRVRPVPAAAAGGAR